MSDRKYCRVCERWVGGGVYHDTTKHDFAGDTGPVEALDKAPSPEEVFDT